MLAPTRIYQTADGDIVTEGDPRAAFLVAGELDRVPREHEAAVRSWADGNGIELDEREDRKDPTDGPAPEKPNRVVIGGVSEKAGESNTADSTKSAPTEKRTSEPGKPAKKAGQPRKTAATKTPAKKAAAAAKR